MRHNFLFSLTAAAAITLSGCASTGTSGSITEQAAVRSTQALSLAELAFTSAEQTATATIQSGQLSHDQIVALGTLVHQGRAYRDLARATVAAGGDASPIIANLNATIANIKSLTGAK